SLTFCFALNLLHASFFPPLFNQNKREFFLYNKKRKGNKCTVSIKTNRTSSFYLPISLWLALNKSLAKHNRKQIS
ncbi:hypothetical protein RYX36_029920, partial [Vicia faba]